MAISTSYDQETFDGDGSDDLGPLSQHFESGESESGEEEEEVEDHEPELEDHLFTLEDYQQKFQSMHQYLILESRAGSTAIEGWQHNFIDTYAEYLRPQIQAETLETEQKNFLYKVARDGPDLPWLVSYLVEHYPSLLDERDAAGRNALLFATSTKQIGFVRSVLRSNIAKATLSMALAASGEHGNCIHQAIVNSIDPEVTVQLIEAASEETLETQDGKGLTPLHCAVEFARCTESRFQVIKALIRCGNRAFDKVGNPPGEFSAYRYHIYSKRQYEQKKARASGRAGNASEKVLELGSREKTAVDSANSSVRGKDSLARNKELESGGVIGVARLATANLQLKNHLSLEPVAQDVASSTTEKDLDGKGSQVSGGGDLGRIGHDKPLRDSGPKAAFHPTKLKRALTNGLMEQLGDPLALARGQNTMGADIASFTMSLAVVRPQSSLSNKGEPPTVKVTKSSKRTKSTKAVAGSRTERPSPEIAEAVAKELKRHYLRTVFWRDSPAIESQPSQPGVARRIASSPRTHDSAIEFLYAENKDDKHICFEFPPAALGKAVKINFADFRTSYDAFSFDKVMLYVDFGLVEVEAPPARARRHGTSTDTGAGRKDMVKFFGWLREKEVTNIMKVIVEDRREVPHSDGAIIAALKDFSIEILDWRKIDLDPRAIQEACEQSTIRELHLWWSGNKAILRAWSEPDGIVKLAELERVHIHQVQGGLESPDRVAKNLEDFELRLQSGRRYASGDEEKDHPSVSRQQNPPKEPDSKPIFVTHDMSGDPFQSRPKRKVGGKQLEGRSALDTYRWLLVMDIFAQGIHALAPPPVPSPMSPPMSFDDYLNYKGMPDELRKDVRVALIDDGADFMHKAINGILEKKGRSFDTGDEDPEHSGAPRPFHGSTTGHGTCMAYMIGRVCPKVKIFAIKLDVIRGEARASFTAKSAADAVEFAVHRGFDIISMSWTIQKSSDPDNNNAHDIQRLENALKLAASKKMLIFCSAPDIGGASSELLKLYYPFGCSSISNNIFKIGAAKADGTKYGWSGGPGSVDFILPGHNVEIREEDRISEQLDTPKTGSSVATALAAGLAALIIHCVRLGAVYNWHGGKADDANTVNKDTLVAIRQFDAMKAAFQLISNHDKDDRRVEVDNFFREPGGVLNKAHAEEDAKIKWDQITQLARDLVSSQTQSSVAAEQKYRVGR